MERNEMSSLARRLHRLAESYYDVGDRYNARIARREACALEERLENRAAGDAIERSPEVSRG